MLKVYGFSDYDKNLALKIHMDLWLVIIYLLRPIVLMISAIRMGRGDSGVTGAGGLRDMVYPDSFSLFLGIAAAIPVFIVLFAYMKRKPDASDLIRKIWRHGMLILMGSALLNIVIVFLPLFLHTVGSINVYGWGQLGIALLIIGYLYSSERVKDTFADFPADITDEKPNGKSQGSSD